MLFATLSLENIKNASVGGVLVGESTTIYEVPILVILPILSMSPLHHSISGIHHMMIILWLVLLGTKQMHFVTGEPIL